MYISKSDKALGGNAIWKYKDFLQIKQKKARLSVKKNQQKLKTADREKTKG